MGKHAINNIVGGLNTLKKKKEVQLIMAEDKVGSLKREIESIKKAIEDETRKAKHGNKSSTNK